ncbi:MAG: hypothetical protein QM541_16770 [Flavobacterium sp.]|nr:hypothetical protein [Flavobacterium sp.]
MKKFITVSLTILLLFQISSCSKETPTPTTTYSIQGLWSGTHQNTTTPAAQLNMSIKADGTVTYENILLGTQQFCSGTWTLTGTTFTCYTTCIYGLSSSVGVKQTFTATFNNAAGTLSSGQWVNTFPASAANSGTFSLTKVN